MVEERTRKILLCSFLCILFWPLSMIIIGIRFRNECPGQSQLSIYQIIYGSIWMLLFLLNILRCYLLHRYIDALSIIIWLILLLLIIPGYVYVFRIRSVILMYDDYPDGICEKTFYIYSSVLIILVHIPLYLFLWISWSLTRSSEFTQDSERSRRIFAIATI